MFLLKASDELNFGFVFFKGYRVARFAGYSFFEG
jgi:hypothetical protein